VFVFGAGTVLAPAEYLVLCKGRGALLRALPGCHNVVGDMSFGLDGTGELVRLFDAGDVPADWVLYDDAPPWPPEPDGHGPTLELINALSDNSLAASWSGSIAAHGTPGAMNSVSTGTGIEEAAWVAGHRSAWSSVARIRTRSTRRRPWCWEFRNEAWCDSPCTTRRGGWCGLSWRASWTRVA